MAAARRATVRWYRHLQTRALTPSLNFPPHVICQASVSLFV
jgi:hypothetical protein